MDERGFPLPDEWKWVRLSEVVEFTIKPTGLAFSSPVTFIPMELVPDDRIFADDFLLKDNADVPSGVYCERGDILLPRITPSFENGKQGIVGDIPTNFAYATTEVFPLKPSSAIDSLYLFFYLLRSQVRSELAEKMQGTTGRQRIPKSALADLSIPLPPIPRQRAISHSLFAIYEAKVARRKELAMERERKAALVEHLFTYGTRGESRKQTEIGLIPDSWRIVRLGDVSEFLQYGTSKRCNLDSSGTPVLRIPNVVGGRIDLGDLKYIKLPLSEADGLRLAPGDLIFVRTNGRREYTGRCAVYEGEPRESLFASYLIRARLQTNILLPKFVQVHTDRPEGRSFLSGRASHAADGKFNINSQTIRAVLVPAPMVIEQQAIVEAVGASDKKLTALERENQVLDELFRALLEELMMGRLSVVPLQV